MRFSIGFLRKFIKKLWEKVRGPFLFFNKFNKINMFKEFMRFPISFLRKLIKKLARFLINSIKSTVLKIHEIFYKLGTKNLFKKLPF